MNNQQPEAAPGHEAAFETIRTREEIKAPEGYVSVYHDTTEAAVDRVNLFGLEPGHTDMTHPTAEAMLRRHDLFDRYRPAAVAQLGVSRNCVYAFPSLEHGNALPGPNQRYIKQDERRLRGEFASFKEYGPEFLTSRGITTEAEYIAYKTDPAALRTAHPGEVLEMKIDPERAYVADMEYIGRVDDDIRRGMSEEAAVAHQAEYYWGSLVKLSDFLTYYKTPADRFGEPDPELADPESTAMFARRKEAPVELPEEFGQPEVLITQPVPPENIRVVE